MPAVKTKLIRITLKIVVAVCFVLIASFFILDSLIKKKIRQQLTNLPPSAQVKFSAVRSSLFSSSVSFDSLEINFVPYSGLQENRHVFKFSRASLQRISFYEFLFHKKLVAGNFLLEDGNIQLDQFLMNKKDSLQAEIIKKIKWPFKTLDINSIQLRRTVVFLRTQSSNQLIARGDAGLGRVTVDTPGTRPSFSSINLHLADINYKFPQYEIGIKELELSSGRRTLSIDSFRLIPLIQNYSQAKICSLNMIGVDVMKLLNEQELLAEKIILHGSAIAINDENLKTKVLPLDLKKINANVFQVENSFVQYSDKAIVCSFRANIEFHKLNLDKPFHDDDFHFGSIRASLSGLQYSGKKYQSTTVQKIEVDSKKETMVAQNISIIPRIGKYELGRKLGHQADWMAANISSIKITKLKFQGLFQKKLFAEKMSIGKSRVYVFRDRRLERQQKILPLPVEYMATLPINIRIKTCTLATSTIEYEEYPRSGFGQTGILKITNASVTISPLINHPAASDPSYIVMNAAGSIMGSGTVHGVIMMPLQKNKPYHIKGAIERLQLTTLNSSSENLGKLRIKSGFLDFLSFDFTMTEQRSTGKIVGAYHHLIIQQLKKHTDEKNVADFASFMLRHLIIPLNKDRSLPERKRTGLVNYTRDPTRFVSYYFLQSLLTGVKKSFTLGFLLPK